MSKFYVYFPNLQKTEHLSHPAAVDDLGWLVRREIGAPERPSRVAAHIAPLSRDIDFAIDDLGWIMRGRGDAPARAAAFDASRSSFAPIPGWLFDAVTDDLGWLTQLQGAPSGQPFWIMPQGLPFQDIQAVADDFTWFIRHFLAPKRKKFPPSPGPQGFAFLVDTVAQLREVDTSVRGTFHIFNVAFELEDLRKKVMVLWRNRE